ncbi:SRPBCC family protein [Blautia sp. An46]|uniref:SRPBCC family protein n=1 Tax=Blautia sp. An46 TaxID=1965636 RepID=UPI000B3AAE91|nr:SRPBCC family protein [Blautia sp. An46]OUN90643.1 polyketide cyclase [Blautia sp. An46]
MAVSNIKTVLSADISKVWDVVTDVENYSWRSDLSRTELLGKNQFVEYTKEGYPTTFTITSSVPYERWEFDMENSNMKGHWVGIFIPKEGKTEIEFTENVTVKKIFLRPFIKRYLRRQQALFVADLEKALG